MLPWTTAAPYIPLSGAGVPRFHVSFTGSVDTCSVDCMRNKCGLINSVPFGLLSYIIILDPQDEEDYLAYVCNITPWLTPHFN